MSLYDDVYRALDMGYGSFSSEQDVKEILEKAKKDAEEKGLVVTGFQTLEYKKDDSRGGSSKTYQIPIYNTAEQAAVDLLFQEKIASGEYVKAEDVDKVPEAKIYQGDYVSKFAEGGEGYVNPYQDETEALKNIPKEFPGQNVLQGFADLKSTPIPELQINPAVTAPVTAALPVNTTYNNSAAINNIVGGLSSVTAPISVEGLGTISGSGAVTPPSTDTKPALTQAVVPPVAEPGTVPGTEYQSKYDPAAAEKLIAEYKANKAKEALLNPAPIPEPYDGLNKTYPPQTSSSGYNFGLPSDFKVMGSPDVQPPAAQPPAAAKPNLGSSLLSRLMSRRKQGGDPTPDEKQPEILEKSQKKRLDAEMVTRQNMARAGQTADIRLGIQNGRTASGLDAFKRRFKIGQQSPSTNLMINA